MMNQKSSSEKIDEIGNKYYKCLTIYAWIERILFFLCVILSLLVYYSPCKLISYYDFILPSYLVCSIGIFIISHTYKLYLFPRAEEERSKNFYGTAYDVTLSQETTHLYYNNDFKEPQLKLALQLLENTFYTKAITNSMVIFQRCISIIYFIIWLWMLAYRNISIDLMIVFSQILFCEFIFSKTLRLELLNYRVEKIYNELFLFIRNYPTINNYFSAKIANLITRYEVVKSISSISLSTIIFNHKCDDLKNEWTSICADIKKCYPSFI